MFFEAANWCPDQERAALEVGLARPVKIYLLADRGQEDDTAVITSIEEPKTEFKID